MEQLNKDGIKFDEMNTEQLIEKIGMIEDLRRENTAHLRKIDPASNTKANRSRPKQIWDMLMAGFGSDWLCWL